MCEKLPSKGHLTLTVVSPTFNERENVGRLVSAIETALREINYEILIVDDDSPDRTWEAVAEMGASDPRLRLLRRAGPRGLARAVIDGFLDARGELVACIDADLQHDPSILSEMYAALMSGKDFAIGSRYVAEGQIKDWSWIRRQESMIATRLAVLLIGVKISDPMSGFFMLRRADFMAVREQLSGEGFKILLELLATLRPQHIAEIPFTFGPRHAGESKLNSGVVIAYLRQLGRLSRRARNLRTTIRASSGDMAA